MKHSTEQKTAGSNLSALKTIIASFVLIVLALAGVYAYGILYFSSHFGFNTTVDGRNVTFLTISEAEDRIGLNASRFDMLVSGREGLELALDAADVGLRYAPDGQIAAIFHSQNPLEWPLRFLPQTNYQTEPSFSYDSGSLRTFLSQSGIFEPQNMRPPVNAFLRFTDGLYTIQDEDPGTTLDAEATIRVIGLQLETGQAICDLDLFDCYIQPDIDADNPELVAQLSDFNTYTPFQINYIIGDKTETLDAFIAIEWFITNEDGSKTLDTKALDVWLTDFANRYNTVGTQRTFTSMRGDEITIGGGTYGWQLDMTAERNGIIAAIANQSSETREPYFTQRGAVHPDQPGLPDWGGTYVEIDQVTQKLYYFVDGELFLESDVVTGLPTALRSTPNGVFKVLSKTSPANLRGPIMPDGEPEWDSWVQYWMQVTSTGVGMHDAYWQPWFGGNRYLYGGSHGCINLPYSKAQTMYYSIEIGTPVIIHN